MDAFTAYIAIEVQILLLFIGVWRKAVLATFLSALVGLECIAYLAIDGTLTLISNGVMWYTPVGYVVFPISVLVIYALVALRAEFSMLRIRKALGKVD